MMHVRLQLAFARHLSRLVQSSEVVHHCVWLPLVLPLRYDAAVRYNLSLLHSLSPLVSVAVCATETCTRLRLSTTQSCATH